MIFLKDLDRRADAQEARGKKMMLRALKMQYAGLVKQFINGQDLKPDKTIIKDALQAYHSKVQIEMAEWQYNYLDKGINKKALQLGMYEKILSKIRAWILLNIGSSINSISKTSLEQVRKIIAEGQEAGFGAAKIAANIRKEAVGEFTRYRATLIARTEGTRASSQGTKFGSDQWKTVTGLKPWHAWSASSDARTRDTHLAMIGSLPIPEDEDFIVGGTPMDGPGDPKGGAENCVACRCRQYFMSERMARQIIISKAN